ncbi:MAG TPA: hypothetical protein PLX15_00750 [Candidatus Woesearchaeota archaeon]|nr:hypothetical protein [Candidatus Woesearchaeota archaeon]
MKIFCTFCGYHFENRKEEVPKICPYCGRNDTLEQEKSVQKFLDESSEDI